MKDNYVTQTKKEDVVVKKITEVNNGESAIEKFQKQKQNQAVQAETEGTTEVKVEEQKEVVEEEKPKRSKLRDFFDSVSVSYIIFILILDSNSFNSHSK